MYSMVFTLLSIKHEQLDVIQLVKADSWFGICQLDLIWDVKYAS